MLSVHIEASDQQKALAQTFMILPNTNPTLYFLHHKKVWLNSWY